MKRSKIGGKSTKSMTKNIQSDVQGAFVDGVGENANVNVTLPKETFVDTEEGAVL